MAREALIETIKLIKRKNPIANGFTNPYKNAFKHLILPKPKGNMSVSPKTGQ